MYSQPIIANPKTMLLAIIVQGITARNLVVIIMDATLGNMIILDQMNQPVFIPDKMSVEV